jgi:hypothetical protein
LPPDLFLAGCSSAEPASALIRRNKFKKVKCISKKSFTRHPYRLVAPAALYYKTKAVCHYKDTGVLLKNLKKTMRLSKGKGPLIEVCFLTYRLSNKMFNI